MSSLRDQLLGLGFKQEQKPAANANNKQHNRSAAAKAGKDMAKAKAKQKPQTHSAADGINLAHAYRMRAQIEQQEQQQKEKQKQQQAQQRKMARAAFDAWLQTITPLNDANAEIARHFEYGGKIKRIYVTAAQLKALNAGELGVLQQRGRYVLVTAAQLQQAQQIFAEAVALQIDPNAPAEENPYSDPKYQIPDDLVW